MDSSARLRFGLAIASMFATQTVSADISDHLASAFEGRAVVVRLDMPATASGVNIYPERRHSLDVGDYRYNLSEYGVALPAGSRVVVTKVKVKDDLIEFQLGGGGYGTFLDVLSEGDSPWERAEARARRFDSGSRVNVRFDHGVPPRVLTPRGLREALSEFVDFRDFERGSRRERWDAIDPDNGRCHGPRCQASCRGAGCAALDEREDDLEQIAGVGDDRGSARLEDLRTGLTRAEVDARLGPARAQWRRSQGDLQVVVCTYGLGDDALEAEFVEDVLVRFRRPR